MIVSHVTYKLPQAIIPYVVCCHLSTVHHNSLVPLVHNYELLSKITSADKCNFISHVLYEDYF